MSAPPTKINASKSKTLYHDDGRVIMFGIEEFANHVCGTDCCFICGADRESGREFNDEHVISRWILKRYNLFSLTMTLPNGDRHQYGTYTMPCCMACNSLLGERLETPMSEMLDGGFDAVSRRLEEPGSIGKMRVTALYVWLCLVFLKTHLKDRQLREHLDRRKGDGRIADQYAWQTMHHIHCIARMPYVMGTIDPQVLGTIRWYRIEDNSGEFDYFDLTNEQTIVMRLGDIGIVAVLGDADACSSAWYDWLAIAHGQTLTMVQLRELAARLALAHRDLTNRPDFYTLVDRGTVPASVRIGVLHDPYPIFKEMNAVELGELMQTTLHRFVGAHQNENSAGADSAWEMIGTGKASFLLDESRTAFHSMVK